MRRQTFSHEKNLHKKDRRTLNYTHRRLSKGQWGYIKKRGYVYFDISSSCGGDPTRTNDLQVMSLASYQLLHSAMLRCVRDSNPWPPAWQAGILTGWTNAPMFFCGQRWIRTTEGVSQQIYSLPHLATLVFAPLSCFASAKVTPIFLMTKKNQSFLSLSLQILLPFALQFHQFARWLDAHSLSLTSHR